jgi:hypothetical protein
MLTRRQASVPGCQDNQEGSLLVAARRAEVPRWSEVPPTYRLHRETLSRTLHPCNIDDTPVQTSTPVARRLHAEVEAIEALAARHQCPACHAARTKVRKQLPALAALVDFWWAGVEQEVEHAGVSTRWRPWAKEGLFPYVSWAHPVAHTRCARRTAKLRKA